VLYLLLLSQKAAAKESMLKRQAEAARRKKADECDRWWRGAELLFGPRTEANGAPPGSDATVKSNGNSYNSIILDVVHICDRYITQWPLLYDS
jgi:hypothetical protein